MKYLICLGLLMAFPLAAAAQTNSQTLPPQGPKDGVIQPPPQVDPAIKKTPPASATTYPTPIVKPPPGSPKAK